MADDSLQRRADLLAVRVEALADALHAGRVPEEASARLLARASAAVLQALNLELLTSGALPTPSREPVLAQASYCLVFDSRDEPFQTFAAVRAAA